MDLILQNPAGLWMLLGIPVVLAIHMLQSRSRRCEVSTLFLLEHLPEESRQGATLRRLRNSLALWLQLLAVVVATWLLAQPLLLRNESFQSVAFVLDSSCSMQPFLPGMLRLVEHESARLDRAAARTEWRALPSDPTRPAPYTGPDRDSLIAALQAWKPDSASHDPLPALLRARDLVGPQGLVVFVTDHLPESLPTDTLLLAVGHPLDNTGFGSPLVQRDSDGTLHWSVLLINHSGNPQHRTLIAERDTLPSLPETFSLTPGQARLLQGTAPPGTARLRLRLDPDSFPLDDTLDLLPPRARPIRFFLDLPDTPARDHAARLMSALADASTAESPASADLLWRLDTSPPPPESPQRSEIVLAVPPPPAQDQPAPAGDILAASHPLTRDLEWHSLLARVLPGFPLRPDDQVLLWMGDAPLVLLRENNDRSQLILRFDWAASNASRVPSMILLLHRFIEQTRLRLPGSETLNVELDQPLRLSADPQGPSLDVFLDGQSRPFLSRPPSSPLNAPSQPGIFEVRQNNQLLLRAAAHFADTREADFRRADSRNDLASHTPGHVSAMRRPATPFLPVLALLATLITASWASIIPRRPRQ